jgi:signal peptidase I
MNRSLGISEDLLSNGFNVRINTCGLSMFPLLRTGDSITISPDQNPDIGDIIVFKRNDHMFGHRLAKVFEKKGVKYYQTRGDSFFGLDEPITSDQILGKVTGIERKNISFARRILILIHPILKFGKLNPFVIAILIKFKAIFPSPKSH